MTLLEIFEKVNLVTPIEQRRFFNYFEDTVNELLSAYEEKFVIDDVYTRPADLSDNITVKPLYHNAIVDNILFLCNLKDSEMYKSEFMRKARQAYLTYWNDNAKGRRVKKLRW